MKLSTKAIILMATLCMAISLAVRSVLAQPSESPARAGDAASLGSVEQLRREVFLDDTSLAALACSRQQAAGAVSGAKTWGLANQARLSGAESNVQQAEAAVMLLNRRMATESGAARLTGDLTRAEAEVRRKREARQALVEEFCQNLRPHFTSDQQVLWDRAHASSRMGLEAFLTADPRTVTGKAELAAIRARVNQHIAGVSAAAEEVLPRPRPVMPPVQAAPADAALR